MSTIATISQPSGLIKPAFTLSEGFVAPRGVCLCEGYVITADTAQNKVFIFEKVNDAYTLKLTLGNKDTMRNICSASSLQYPSGVWTNGRLLIVADAWNHRVLIWSSFPARDYQDADIVIGQEHFNSNQPNIHGLAKGPSAQSLYWPYGVWSNGHELWIADTGNRRVLYYKNIPAQNFATADEVIGQNSFEEKEYDPDNAIWPYSVKVSDSGEMLITDTQYYRCLYWKNWEIAREQKCDIIIGQRDMQANGQNQFNLKPAANTLNWCYDACFGSDKIFVADTGNSRVLSFDKLYQNDQSAISLIGQENFNTNGEASLSLKSIPDNTDNLYWPFAISYFDGMLAVADTGKSRILIYKTVAL